MLIYGLFFKEKTMMLTLNLWTLLSLWWQATSKYVGTAWIMDELYVAWLIFLMNLICINHVWLHNGGRHLLKLM